MTASAIGLSIALFIWIPDISVMTTMLSFVLWPLCRCNGYD
ncbi:hypothetical protein GPLA_0565 [Paraglaciecola polaris LMG 21857]|uniref:Uncharacterized protein n=1 Tax=Paraglaciecola polaris LMG 21857 TaxID=1129793 RepID=K6ZME5_9ALTE|nr:hypothetical protein GPLA_0565 [Paraglaciecola polaris LMG 21857]